jgi:hypothetical protein
MHTEALNNGLGVVAHGMVGGMSSAFQGGDFHSGFFAAAFTKGASVVGVFGPPDGNPILNAITSGIVGGKASVIGGGKFANGAVTGAMSRLLNDMAITGRQAAMAGRQAAIASSASAGRAALNALSFIVCITRGWNEQ